MILELKKFEKAIVSLENVLKKTNDREFMNEIDEVAQNAMIAGAIKNFEFAYEISWKYIKKWLQINIGKDYIDGITRRELFRLARENLLIKDIEKWMDFHYARNNTAHAYNREIADEVYKIANDFIIYVKQLYEILKEKND